MLSSGSKLGRYQIHSAIGAGGMGEVFLAEDVRLNRKVALKILPEKLLSDDDRLRRFEREARAASALNHPNILTIYEIGDFDGTHFIATEFIEGETLREKLNRESLRIEEALEIAVQTASALSAAHASGIIHRDIKPENIMLRQDHFVKVLDFGLAKLTRQDESAIDTEAETRAQVKTAPGVVLGTVNYMSPEQARGKETDARTDIWSLGCVMYEMLAGRTPFDGETTADRIASIIHKEPGPLSRLAENVPARLEEIVAKCLEKKADERYQTVKDLLIDLRRLKRKLDFEAEMERSVAPEDLGKTDREAANQTQTLSAAQTDAAQSLQTTSSAEYVVTEIKRHKSAFFAGLVILLLATVGLGFWYFSSRFSGASQIESVAVLPFQNASGNENAEYLSDGITESLINSLTELRQLRVIARSTAFRYKNKEIDPQTVGRELNARAVLTGRVRQTGDRLSIQVDLVDALTGAQLWGKDYERQSQDALSIKQAIVKEIISELGLKLSGVEQRQIAKRDTTSAEAYQFYLRGRYYWNKRTSEGTKKAIAEFQQAIERDPNYALAYAGLADSFGLLPNYTNIPSSEAYPKAKAYAERALQIDDSLAEAHTSLAFVYDRQWQWEEAEKQFRRAIELNPNYPTARHWYSMHLRKMGRFDEASAEIKRAQELDPLSLVINVGIAWDYLSKRDASSAAEQCKKVLELDPNFHSGYSVLGIAYLKQGRYPEAITVLEKVSKDERGDYLGILAYAYALAGRRAEALATLKKVEEEYARQNAGGIDVAIAYAGIGDVDQAFAWLEKDFQARANWLPDIKWSPEWDSIRTDPRYGDLLRRMGLEP